MLLHLCRWLQDNSFIDFINGTAWTAAALEVAHYFSMFILVGCSAIVDLRVLGALARRESAAQLAGRLFPWMWYALALNVFSGFFMFAGSAVSYYRNDVFYDKVGVIVLAVAATTIVQLKIRKWDESPAMPVDAKFIALVSILLWAGAIVAGVEVPALTNVG
jgi:uncharacterized membrane protein